MKIRALYVDDSAEDRELVKAVLGDHPDLELVVATPRDFREKLGDRAIDLVLTDLHLGPEDGFAVLEAARRERPELAVVILTGTGDESLAVEALRRGVDDYLVKHVEVLRRLPELLRQSLLRRAAEREAEHARLEGDAMFAALPDPTLVGELATGRILRANPTCEARIAGLTGRRWTELPVTADRAAAHEALEALRAGQCVSHAVLHLPTSDGRLLELDWCATPAGERFVAVARDLGEQRRLETHLREAELLRHLGCLTAGLARELDGVLDDFVGRARDADPTGAVVDAGLSGALDRLAALTRRLASLGAARGEGQEELVDLAQTCRDLLPVLEQLAGPGVRVRARLPDSGPLVRVDRVEIERCLLDLTANAAEAMGGRGELRLGLGTVEDAHGTARALLSVEDDGPGFPAAVRERAFEPFVTSKREGSGLGLPAVMAAARRAGGSVRVAATEGTRGARIELLLPVAAGQPPPAPSLGPGPTIGSLLVLDDEPALASLMLRVLEGEVARATAAGSIEEAERRRAREGPFDVVVSDVRLQDGSGEALIRRWRSEQPSIRGLLVSGHPLRSPDLPVLLKPFTPSELRAAVGKLVESAATEGTAEPG